MEYNISELMSMSNSELLETMKGLSVSDRRDIWNAIADSDVSKIRDFSTYCKNTKITKVLTKGKRKGQSVSVRAYDEFCEPMFSLTIRNAWDNERNLIREGKGTRNWTKDQQRAILNIEDGAEKNHAGIPKFEMGDEALTFQGHHMLSVSGHPEFAGDWHNIQALTFCEHRKEAHNGNTRLNQTHGYYD